MIYFQEISPEDVYKMIIKLELFQKKTSEPISNKLLKSSYIICPIIAILYNRSFKILYFSR